MFSRTLLRHTTTLTRRHLTKNALIPKSIYCYSTKPNDNSEVARHRILGELKESRTAPMLALCQDENHHVTTQQLESLEGGSENIHYKPKTLGDKTAFMLVRALRTLPDVYFGRNHYMRAVMLETIAAVPAMVASMLTHMKSLRKMTKDSGWISHLLHEAENERIHLMIWLKCLEPGPFNRLLVLGAQAVFFHSYLALYCISPRIAHRFVGYLEEESVISYTHFLNDIDNGIIKNGKAPDIAIDYYNLLPDATIRDVVLVIRAEEGVHRDNNHFLSDRIAARKEDLTEP